MIKRLYEMFHRMISKPNERGEYSSGPWPDMIRLKAIKVCKSFKGDLLEVGCGEGLFLTQLAAVNPKLKLWGIDNSLERLKEAEENKKRFSFSQIQVSKQDILKLDFPDNHFDVVVCVNVFFNLPSLEMVQSGLNEMQRVCKSEGKVIFEFRNSLNPLVVLKYKLAPFYDATVKTLPLNTFYPKQIQEMLKIAGLKIDKETPLGFFFKRYAPIILVEAKK